MTPGQTLYALYRLHFNAAGNPGYWTRWEDLAPAYCSMWETIAEQFMQPKARYEKILRKLLAVRVAGAFGYYDDGELQDSTTAPFIDFLRDSPEEIERKLIERSKINLVKRAADN